MILRVSVCIILMFVYSAQGAPSSAAEAIKDEQLESGGFRKVEYKADEFRDPFRTPSAFDSQENKDNSATVVADMKKNVPSLKFQGVIWGGATPLVIINDKILKIGDSIEDCRILEINKEGVTVFYINKRHTFPLPGGLKGGSDEKNN